MKINIKRAAASLALVFAVSAANLNGQSDLYGDRATQRQTRNLPAGSVVDPGSQLLYIVDTGIDLRAAVGPDLSEYRFPLSDVNPAPPSPPYPVPNPFGVGGARSIYTPAGLPIPGRYNRNFIAMTNTHTTEGVTLLVTYFNDEVDLLLKFFVTLTCNDTLIFDPFDFAIPGTPFNTSNRIFGPALGALGPIPAGDFGSGRFLISATAVGVSYEPNNPTGWEDDSAELRFAYEFRNLINPLKSCHNLQSSRYFGAAAGAVANNLHVFNASAVSFNYLVGHFTNATTSLGHAYGLNAWARPAVDLSRDRRETRSRRRASDGDGPPLVLAGTWRILTGRENVLASDGVSQVLKNDLYLRNEVHGGDTRKSLDAIGNVIFDSWYGGLSVTSLCASVPPDQQSIHLLSVVDDYNGSELPYLLGPVLIPNHSYRLSGAQTVYVLQIYDCEENLRFKPFNVRVRGLRTWVSDRELDSQSVDSLQIGDLIRSAPDLASFFCRSTQSGNLSAGWIRFVRNNSVFDSTGLPRLYGTWVPWNSINDSTVRASFVTIGFQEVHMDGYGAAWWLTASASDYQVSDSGKP